LPEVVRPGDHGRARRDGIDRGSRARRRALDDPAGGAARVRGLPDDRVLPRADPDDDRAPARTLRRARDLGDLLVRAQTQEDVVSRPLLEVSGISLAFGGLKAVSNFGLELSPGNLQGLIGPNGAGTTTVFNLLTGIYRPDAGEIR